jgi:hypothetical protein
MCDRGQVQMRSRHEQHITHDVHLRCCNRRSGEDCRVTAPISVSDGKFTVRYALPWSFLQSMCALATAVVSATTRPLSLWCAAGHGLQS